MRLVLVLGKINKDLLLCKNRLKRPMKKMIMMRMMTDLQVFSSILLGAMMIIYKPRDELKTSARSLSMRNINIRVQTITTLTPR